MVAIISRLLKITGLFCKRILLNRQYSVKETYNFKEPTNRSHPICVMSHILMTRRLHYFWHDSLTRAMIVTTQKLRVWHESFIPVTWLLHISDMIWHARRTWPRRNQRVWRKSFICVTWLLHTCNRLFHTCDTTHWHVRKTWPRRK